MSLAQSLSEMEVGVSVALVLWHIPRWNWIFEIFTVMRDYKSERFKSYHLHLIGPPKKRAGLDYSALHTPPLLWKVADKLMGGWMALLVSTSLLKYTYFVLQGRKDDSILIRWCDVFPQPLSCNALFHAVKNIYVFDWRSLCNYSFSNLFCRRHFLCPLFFIVMAFIYSFM